MPEESAKVTVITFPQPTANGALHVGHLSGPYIAADVAARAARARGERVLVSTGLDIHQNYVLVRAENEGLDVGAMMTDFRADIERTYALAGIGHDVFTDPQDPGHDPTIAGILATMVERGQVPMREVKLLACSDCDRTLHQAYVVGTCATCGAGSAGGACEGCGSLTCSATLLNPSCARCGGAPRPFVANVPVLALEDHRDALVALWLRAEYPARVRGLIRRQLDAGLPEIPLAYPTNWGVECTGPLTGLRVDPYVEVALTDLYGIARGVDPTAADLDGYIAAWGYVGGLWHFHGIDNAAFYALLWPALWAAAGVDPLPQAGLVVNDFYRLDGLKFSTSRNHAIWANEILTEEDPAIVRLFLAWDRPDRYASDFTRASFTAFRDRVAPLLAGNTGSWPGLAPGLVAAERERGERALELAGFDAALAARSLMSVLASGARDGILRTALTGRRSS